MLKLYNLATMREDRSYGVVPVVRDEHGNYKYLIVKQSPKHWSFPRGHKEKGEEPMDAARRELTEEAGVTNVRLKKRPRFSLSFFFTRNGHTYKKTVDHFLGFVDESDTTNETKGHMESRWVSKNEAYELLHRNTADKVLNKAHRFLTKRRKKRRR